MPRGVVVVAASSLFSDHREKAMPDDNPVSVHCCDMYPSDTDSDTDSEFGPDSVYGALSAPPLLSWCGVKCGHTCIAISALVTATVLLLAVGLYVTAVARIVADNSNGISPALRQVVKVGHWLIAPFMGIVLGLHAILVRYCIPRDPATQCTRLTGPSVSPRLQALFGFRKDGNVFRWTRSAHLILFAWVAVCSTLVFHCVAWITWFVLGLNT